MGPKGGAAGGYLLVGEIRRAHGIRGECRVLPTTDHPESVYAPGRVLALGSPAGEVAAEFGAVTVVSARPFKGELIVRFREVRDRSIAEAFRARTLLIPREEAQPLATGEYFVSDLVGLEVRTVAGDPVGRVQEVYEVGTVRLLGVEDGGEERLLPFRKEIVKDVDLVRRVVTIDPPAGWTG